jgi:iron complex outermembrane receptor protein
MGYGGRRDVRQFLSVPVAAQSDPLSSGGVVELANACGGADAHLAWRSGVERPLELSLGLAADKLRQQRRGYENFSGAQLGVQGTLRRDETDRVGNFDQYVQGEWRFAQRWAASAGLRHSVVRFDSQDRYVAAGNPDDGGSRRYAAYAPVAGLAFRAAPQWRVYAAYGSGFETPTLNELAYRTDGSAGLNLQLAAARSNHYELGVKQRGDGGQVFAAALFEADSRNELAVAGSSGGRTSFHNIGRARRRGAELRWQQPLAPRWALATAYTFLDARFRSDFSNCPTPATCTIPAGARIPGVPRHDLSGAVRWRLPSGWHAAAEAQALSRIGASDDGAAQAAGYAVVGLSAGWRPPGPGARPWLALRADNLLDRRYIGSLIVNEANGRYFEPGAGLSVYAAAGFEF